jgi:hypothetical protein
MTESGTRKYLSLSYVRLKEYRKNNSWFILSYIRLKEYAKNVS